MYKAANIRICSVYFRAYATTTHSKQVQVCFNFFLLASPFKKGKMSNSLHASVTDVDFTDKNYFTSSSSSSSS